MNKRTPLLHGELLVLDPYEYENDSREVRHPKDWYAIVDDDGIKAYAGSEKLAFILCDLLKEFRRRKGYKLYEHTTQAQS